MMGYSAWEPWQERVMEEKRLLDVKKTKLADMTHSYLFQTLDQDEKDRLQRQLRIMGEYSQVLDERIRAFK